MTSLELAEKIILDKIHSKYPSLKFTLADLIDNIPQREIGERNNVKYGTVRSLKSRYKAELEGINDEG